MPPTPPETPRPEPIDPGNLHELAHEVIKDARFPMLATTDREGQPRVRPVSPVRVDPDFTHYVANLATYQKTEEIANNHRVELAYLASTHDQLRITGIAVVETDQDLIGAIWESNPLLRRYIGTPDNPEFILYTITPKQVRFMREWALEYYNVEIAS
ncbi:MAG: pyridoxamine 5'-phosphate oxidase family protein [Verrucomicrobiota bacterium]